MNPIYYTINLGNLPIQDFIHQMIRAATQFNPNIATSNLYFYPHATQYDPKLVAIINTKFQNSKYFQSLITNWHLIITDNPYI
jgi:hypothetical protein